MKRPSSDTQPLAKRRKTDIAIEHAREAETANVLDTVSQRTFPSTITVDSSFSLFYRRFPVSSHFQVGEAVPVLKGKGKGTGATYNPPRDALDLYTPRFVRGSGREKVGVCPICCESVARGGEGKVLWLSMKFSAFKCYHMQYYHGISASTGLPFSPPTAFRVVPRPNPGKLEKTKIKQGHCHKCKKWVAVEGIKDMDAKVIELFWWKHAAACHQGSRLAGEGDIYLEDDTYRKYVEASDT
ncbi:hypothetical protein DENSPDRAFT_892538 [Dentipellis sp. KUC8613]|nr:hypothetical protein DENSPDRAFT_892538 [Dentipellis sp. KUC8613]